MIRALQLQHHLPGTITLEPLVGNRRAGDGAAQWSWTIKAKIEQNTSAVEGATGKLRAEFMIVLLPTGEVLSATLLKSSGNKAYDEAAERGIGKSAPLPLPPNNPELFREFRELRLPFTYEKK